MIRASKVEHFLKNLSYFVLHQSISAGNQVNGYVISCSLICPASVSQIFFRCLIFHCYNISICKKEKIKDETSKKIRESNRGQLLLNWTCIGFTNFLRIFFRCLIINCYNISIFKKEKLKDETSKKIHETNGGQIKEQDVPLT